MSHFLECACLIIRGDQLPKRRRLLTRITQVVADVAVVVAVAVEGARLQMNSVLDVCRDHQSYRSGAAMKRPAAANLKRKAQEPVEEVDLDAVQAGDNESPAGQPDEADEGHNKKAKKRSTRKPEEQEVLRSLPELENYRVLRLAISHVQIV